MASTIFVAGEFDFPLLNSFERSLKAIRPDEKNILLRFDSIGGKLDIVNKMSKLLRYQYERGRAIIGQAILAESAAMKLFLNCDEREVTAGSWGSIHLPVPNQPVSVKEYEEKRGTAIAFIRRRTGLSEKMIISLDGEVLGPREMVHYNIAHRKVPSFC